VIGPVGRRVRQEEAHGNSHLPDAPTLKHPEQEEEAEGRPVTVLEDTPLDFRAARACNKRLGACKRRTGVRWADRACRSYAGGYEQDTHDGEDHSDTRKPNLLASR